MKFHELIYCESSIQDVIKKEFPEAVFTDASDIVHTERFSVDIESESENIERDFYIFAIKKGFAKCCFCFELLLRQNPSEISKWIELVMNNLGIRGSSE